MSTAETNLLRIDVMFPLADGRTLVQGPLTYNQDGLATSHNADFMKDKRFIDAYQVGIENSPPGVKIEWRAHIALWCANQAIRVPGDFVECGVHTGILSGAVMAWLDFARQVPRKFFLFDTWTGIPIEQMSDAERRLGAEKMNRKYQNGDEVHAGVVRKFARWPNAVIVRGRIPDSLAPLKESKGIAYASIDLNIAEAEMGAIDIIWPLMTPGGVILLDDYGWSPHIHQKLAWDNWALGQNIMILALPTGQGLILKP